MGGNEATELVVFVASPSDVEAERAAVKEVAQQIENSLGLRLGFRVRVTGWEQVPPSYGRPQDQINPLVDTCDVFIGVLYCKWGSDSGTHSSGFIEEFERAAERRDKGEGPAIAMFFKQVPQTQRDDAGPQLQKVLEFRERIKREHLLLFREFAGTVDFERQLTELLLHCVGETISRQSAAPASPSEEPRSASVDGKAMAAGALGDATSLNDAQVQLLDMLTGYSALLNGDFQNARLDNDRLLLFASAAGSGPFLPTHEANRLYRRRSELSLTVNEANHWLRSMAADWSRDREFRTIPGWAILGPDLIEHKASELLADSDSDVVVGTLTFMTSIGYRCDLLWSVDPKSGDRKVIERWHSLLENPATASSATAHLGTLAGTADSSLLGMLSADITDDPARGDISVILRSVSNDFTDLITAASNDYYLQQWKHDRLIANMPHLETLQLLKLLERNAAGKKGLRQAAASQLVTRGEFTENVVSAALSCKDGDTAKLIIDAFRNDANAADIFRNAIERLEAAGVDTNWQTLANDVPPRILAATEAAEQLEAKMTFDNIAWEARLYQQGVDGAPAARAMLNLSEDAWADTLVAPVRTALDSKQLVPYVYSGRVAAAIRYLSQLPVLSHDDLDLIRARVNDSKWWIQATVAEALSHAGMATDSKILLDAAATANAINRDHMLCAAFVLDAPGAIEATIGTADSTTAEVIKPFLTQLAEDTLMSLLDHPIAMIRIASFDELNRRLDRLRLDALLDQYIAKEQYFYNVAVAIDAALYGPVVGQ